MKIVSIGVAAGAGQPGEQVFLWADQAGGEACEQAGAVRVECWAFPKGSRRAVAKLIAAANESRAPRTRPATNKPAGAAQQARPATSTKKRGKKNVSA